MNDDDTPDPDRPGVARSPSPDYSERAGVVDLGRKRRKTGEYQNPIHAARAIRDLERASSLKTWGMIVSVLLGGSGVGHGLWRSNSEQEKHSTLELQLQHEKEARQAIERDVEKLQSKLEDAQLELAVCCDRRK